MNGDVVLVIQDWGSALGFDWARRHPERVAGIVYIEAMLQSPKCSDSSFVGSLFFRAIRSSLREWLILTQNLFIESILPPRARRDWRQQHASNKISCTQH